MNVVRIALPVVLVGLICTPALAHPHHGGVNSGGGVSAGLLHPLLGFDHLLAMVAVGLLGAQLGGRAVWALPGAFVGSMAVGGVLGLLGWSLPGIEYGIALSIVLLGSALAVNRRLPLAAPLAAAALFGVLHGHAHGVEMPTMASPLLYATGFLSATAALHLTGVGAGLLAVRSWQGAQALRFSGGIIAAAGLVVLATQAAFSVAS